MVFEDKLLKLLAQHDYTPLDIAGLARALAVAAAEEEQFRALVHGLEQTGRIARIRHDRYALPLDADLIAGRILVSRTGAGVLQPDDAKQGRVEIPAEATGTALHQDRVLIRLDPPTGAHREGQLRGKVIRILDRARTRIVGTLQRSKEFFYVIPDDPRIPHDIYVPPVREDKLSAKLGDKVVVELSEWLSRHTNPEGQLVEVLGHPDALEVDIQSILRQYHLNPEFPAAVKEQCASLPEQVVIDDLGDRRDCRAQNVITIDPDDAKDFDDAFYLERAGSQQWKLFVHVADVSHYVSLGSPLDTEARRRGNSTYLVDRVIPMLPEELSNNLCSLLPRVDRLTKCVEFLLSNEGRVLKTTFYSAIIHSRRRFTYREALGVLQKPGTDPLEQMLAEAGRFSQKIRRARMNAGSLDLDFPENKIRLDDKGRVLRVERVENDMSHQLIEEFMLMANEAVAARLKARRIPALYRIHESPDPERLEDFRENLKVQGIRTGNLNDRRQVQKLLQTLKEHPAGDVLKIGFLRSLKRARYAVEPLGHYGLAKMNYTHFTSPIRRYPDLLVHRGLFDQKVLSGLVLAETADHISFTERNSADAEQDSKTVKLLAYLQQQIDSGQREIYAALVTEVRNFGFFVEVAALGFSGAVRVSTLEDDFYHFDPQRQNLVGRRRRRVIAAGDRVQVQIAAVDRFKKHANFRLLEEKPARGGKASAGRSRETGRGVERASGHGGQRAGGGGEARGGKRGGGRSGKRGGGRGSEHRSGGSGSSGGGRGNDGSAPVRGRERGGERKQPPRSDSKATPPARTSASGAPKPGPDRGAGRVAQGHKPGRKRHFRRM